MTAYAIAEDEVAAWSKTLAAATVDTVTFTDRHVATVRVYRESGAAIFFTTDGTVPTVNGAHCHRVPADLPYVDVDVDTGGATVVKLISSGTPTYSVEGA